MSGRVLAIAPLESGTVFSLVPKGGTTGYFASRGVLRRNPVVGPRPARFSIEALQDDPFFPTAFGFEQMPSKSPFSSPASITKITLAVPPRDDQQIGQQNA
jgi:hypothetical protein